MVLPSDQETADKHETLHIHCELGTQISMQTCHINLSFVGGVLGWIVTADTVNIYLTPTQDFFGRISSVQGRSGFMADMWKEVNLLMGVV